MSFSKIPDRALILPDANVILYAKLGRSPQCAALLERCVEKRLNGILPSFVAADVSHRLMIAEARQAGMGMGSNPARWLAQRPEMARQLNTYQRAMGEILNMGLTWVSPEKEDLIKAFQLQARHGLLSNDALLFALAYRHGVRVVATADLGLHDMPGLDVLGPGDLT